MDFPVSKNQFNERDGVQPTQYDEQGIPYGGPARYPGMSNTPPGDPDRYEGNFDAQTGEPYPHMRRRPDGIIGPALMLVDTDLQTAT
ncbi:hypothetical protein GGI22_007766, partial [Coemansia erecta]